MVFLLPCGNVKVLICGDDERVAVLFCWNDFQRKTMLYSLVTLLSACLDMSFAVDTGLGYFGFVIVAVQ
jgi:hypothetical protein